MRQQQDNQARIVNELDQFTMIVNHTYDEIQANRDQINFIGRTLTNLTGALDREINQLSARLAQMDMRTDVEMLVSQIEKSGDQFVRTHEAWLQLTLHTS